MKLGPLLSSRLRYQPRPKWVLLLAKGFSLLAARNPVLRQSYLAFPRSHLYQHPESIATIAIERDYHGEDAVFYPKLQSPDQIPLEVLDGYLRYYKEAPIDQVDEFKLGLNVSRLWRPLRRSLWWMALNMSGDYRARTFGTFAISVYSGLGAESLHPISPMSYLLNFGTIDPRGEADMRLVYDHRLIDGARVARQLKHLEEILNDEVAAELDCPQPPRVIPFPHRPAA